jgi:RNA-directed DNA polymerase
MSKSYHIPKQRVFEAWKLVKKNYGAAGVDGESLQKFEENLKDNLYNLWNRMSSGSYMPPPVKGVDIPKGTGGIRRLGVPTVSDRVAQTVVKLTLEPELEPNFHEDSYGYRPGKSAHDAVRVTRERCWKFDWLLEFDVKAMFDNIPHSLVMKALEHHTKEKWILLYCERWLKAEMMNPGGELVPRSLGTPQGGVISPLLMNLFLHYGFDLWMGREFPKLPWVRFADDACIHVRTQAEGEEVRKRLESRLREIGLEMHPEKTRLIYCRDESRRINHDHTSFTFLGYEFRSRCARRRDGKLFSRFLPAVGKEQLKQMRRKIKTDLALHMKHHWTIEQVAILVNPVMRGWLNYYGAFYGSEMSKICRHLNLVVCQWIRRKYKRLKGGRSNGFKLMQVLHKRNPTLFVHWKMVRP